MFKRWLKPFGGASWLAKGRWCIPFLDQQSLRRIQYDRKASKQEPGVTLHIQSPSTQDAEAEVLQSQSHP